MLRTLSLACVSLTALAACGSSTTGNEGTTPGVETSSTGSETTVASTDGPADTAAPSSGPESSAAPTTEPAPDTTAASTTAAPTTEAPTTAPPATAAPTSDVAVAYGGSADRPYAPLAWWDGAAWNPAGYVDGGAFVTPPAPTLSQVSATSLDFGDGPAQVVDGLVLGEPQFYCVGDEQGPLIPGVESPTTGLSLGYDVLAVTADWPLQPREVRPIGEDDPEYATIGAELMSDVATGADGQVVQAVRVDLDGDGIEEVLVTYERITDTAIGAGGDFSLVYLRAPAADGSVENLVVEKYVQEAQEDLVSPYPTVGRYTVAAVADLNGDGVMEFATRYQFFESGGMVLYEFSGDTPTEIGSGGCGV